MGVKVPIAVPNMRLHIQFQINMFLLLNIWELLYCVTYTYEYTSSNICMIYGRSEIIPMCKRVFAFQTSKAGKERKRIFSGRHLSRNRRHRKINSRRKCILLSHDLHWKVACLYLQYGNTFRVEFLVFKSLLYTRTNGSGIVKLAALPWEKHKFMAGFFSLP